MDNDKVKRLETELQDAIKAYQDQCDRENGDGHLGLSAWAKDLRIHELRAKIKLAKAGDLAEFDRLYKDGEMVRAKLINGRYGYCWAFCDENGEFTGEFLTDSRGPRAKLTKLGYEVRRVKRPARVKLKGNGTGLAGAASVFVAVVELGGGYE